MENITHQELLDAGVHFGHLKRKWNPKMLPYIFMEKKGIHIIDLNKTQNKLQDAAAAMRQMAKSGRKILFVATKKQARNIVKEAAEQVDMPFVTERWLGGMMTNFGTIKKSIKKMQSIEKMLKDGSLTSVTKKERLVLQRERDKMNKVLGGIKGLNRLPSALFIVDISHEHLAVKEAQNLNIPIFAMVDTNSDPTQVDFPIPSNDDATKSISTVVGYVTQAVKEGLKERQADKQSTKDSDKKKEEVEEKKD